MIVLLAIYQGMDTVARHSNETGGNRTSADGARFHGGLGACSPKKSFNSRVSKMLFLALSGRYIDNLKATYWKFLCLLVI